MNQRIPDLAPLKHRTRRRAGGGAPTTTPAPDPVDDTRPTGDARRHLLESSLKVARRPDGRTGGAARCGWSDIRWTGPPSGRRSEISRAASGAGCGPFGLALADALEAHRDQYLIADRADDPDGALDLDILALACLAVRRGWSVRVESAYLPRDLLRAAESS
ncbi:immunity 49 family protein [Streptomyces sp. NPDC001274]